MAGLDLLVVDGLDVLANLQRATTIGREQPRRLGQEAGLPRTAAVRRRARHRTRRAVTLGGVLTEDGVERPADLLVLNTGFDQGNTSVIYT